MSKFSLEIIAFNIESCLLIEKAGANRIELCHNPADGGTTVSHGMIRMAREKTGIDLFPIIRPRGGDFLYSDEEFVIMQRDVEFCRDMGCDGVVIGLLNADGRIDYDRTARLVQLAYPLEVTFHRAFDRVADASVALEDVIRTGCTRILTSGLHPTATEGIETLHQLVQQAAERIIIMPGSGVRSNNITDIANRTGATEFHSSARIGKPTAMQYINKNMQEDLSQVTTNPEEITELVAQLNNYFKS